MTVFPPPPGFSATYFGFEPCCGGNILYFSFNGTTNAPYEGINIYAGPSAIGYDPLTNSYIQLTNQCYRIFRSNTTISGSPINGSNYGNLQVVPTNFGTNYTWDSTTNDETPCGDETITCPPCAQTCYTLFPCDGSNPPITTSTDLSAYVDGFATIQVDADLGFSCYYVTVSYSCANSIVVVVDGDVPCSCDCTCYEIIGDAKLTYIDCDGNQIVTNTNGYWKDCSLVYPVTNPSPGPNLIITDNGDCIDGQCPSQCFELTDCEGILDPIYTTAQSLSQYAILGQTVIIQGYDNCWTVTDVVLCDCAIDVVVLQAYADCATCTAGPNYILTNCDDLGTIIYTSTDLSAYVGQVVNLDPDCPGCWIVDIINGPIPSDVPVIITDAFDDCEACKTTYYELTDCNGIETSIITSTDLSQYVTEIIVLEWCPTTCWRVSVATTSVGAGILGNISANFDTCIDCLTSFPCICSRITNQANVSNNYDYLDCDGVVQTITILSGERSDRICMAHWLSSYPTDYVEYFGDCSLIADLYTCPPVIYPKRSLKPGYNTPACEIWKYEQISCMAAEALYKQVLELRYGITNCCPDDDQKYIIQKELIDLKALVNPDYICSAPSCGCNSGCSCSGSCGGSCNTCYS
jgi:hypothetical protein